MWIYFHMLKALKVFLLEIYNFYISKFIYLCNLSCDIYLYQSNWVKLRACFGKWIKYFTWFFCCYPVVPLKNLFSAICLESLPYHTYLCKSTCILPKFIKPGVLVPWCWIVTVVDICILSHRQVDGWMYVKKDAGAPG